MTDATPLNRAVPAAYQALLSAGKAAAAAAAAAGIDDRAVELIRVRASQLNGCAYCLRMHTRDAITQGESADRLAVLSAWRETAYFTPLERSALAAVEDVTLIADLQNGRRVTHDGELDGLTDEQLAAVRWLAIVINAFNRVAICSEFDVVPAGRAT